MHIEQFSSMFFLLTSMEYGSRKSTRVPLVNIRYTTSPGFVMSLIRSEGLTMCDMDESWLQLFCTDVAQML